MKSGPILFPVTPKFPRSPERDVTSGGDLQGLIPPFVDESGPVLGGIWE